MQTYTTKNKELDLTKLINKQANEPIIIKNNVGNQFLLMPFSGNKKLDIFLSLYKSFTDLNKPVFETTQKQVENNYTKHVSKLKTKYKDLPIEWGEGEPNINDFVGIWENKNITLKQIRDKAWTRNL